MSVSAPETDLHDYLVAVGAALADLPAAERADLLEDVEEHLREVAAEGEGPLHLLLGPPATYAAELRGAALPEAGEPVAPTAAERLRALAGLLPSRERLGRAALAAGRDLRPGWWVLRGLLVGFLVYSGHAADRYAAAHPPAWLVALAAVLVVVSWAVGRVTAGRGGRPATVLFTLAGVALTVGAGVGLYQLRDRLAVPCCAAVATQTIQTPVESLTQPNGLVQNIYPYDSQGHPLTGVQLFDQDGNPLDIAVGQDAQGNALTRRVPVGAGGTALDNVFPQQQEIHPDGSNQVELQAPHPSVAPLVTNAIAVVPPGPGAQQPVIVSLEPSASPSP